MARPLQSAEAGEHLRTGIDDKAFLTALDVRHIWANQEIDQTMHLLTWNPKPTFYNYDHNGHNDFNRQWLTMVDKLYPTLRSITNYCFVAEISEMGKLHFHGFYQVKDKVKYHRSFLPTLRNNGFIKDDKANSRNVKVMKYYVKDLRHTISCIDHPIILTEDTIEYFRSEIMRCKLAGIKKYIQPAESIGLLAFMNTDDLDDLPDL